MSAVLREESNVSHLRIPPQAIDAEQSVLGGMMLAACSGIDAQERAWANVADVLAADDFYRRDHQLIFRAIQERQAAQQPCDPLVLADWFESQGMGEMVAGGAYLSELCNTTPSAANIAAYAKIVRDKSVLRQLISVGTSIVNDGFDPDGRESDDVIATAAAQVAALSMRSHTSGGLRPIHGTVDEAWNEIVARDAGEVPVGMPLPWGNVRDKLPGLEETDLLVLAAGRAWARPWA